MKVDFNLIQKVLQIVVLLSVLLATWGIGGYFVAYQITLNECVRDFDATGAVVILFNKTYCERTYMGESMIATVSYLRDRYAQQAQTSPSTQPQSP